MMMMVMVMMMMIAIVVICHNVMWIYIIIYYSYICIYIS
jgi:hypothetical protein